jgi:uncharacterized membrane protein YfcA
MTELIIASLVVFAAYFLKAFTGFGPAMIMIPFFTLLFDPGTAITTTTIFDFLAGLILLISVRKQIQWKFVFSIFASLAFGAIFGSLLLGNVPDYWIKKIIGITIFIFVLILLFQKDGNSVKIKNQKIQSLKYPVGVFGGFLGGFIGISGPPIIIYMKMLYEKSFFRTQLIGIFFFGAGWRFILYRINNISFNLEYHEIGIMLVIMLIASWIGTKLHFKVNEIIFNRIVAVLLIVPALNLVLNSQ